MKKLYAHSAFLLLPAFILCTLLLLFTTLSSAQTGLAAKYLPGAEKGIASDLSGLAQCYEYGYGVQENLDEALRLYTLAAFRKDPQAFFRIGYFYKTGLGGLQRDYLEAFKHYKIAAMEGNASAMLYLAELYEEGTGCEKNIAEALKLYLLSGVEGYSLKGAKRCAEALGIDTTSLPKSKFAAYAKYAKDEYRDPRAMYELYKTYKFGWDGIEESEVIALVWLEQAAERGLTEAQAELGYHFYLKGEYAKAEKWLNSAGLKGNQKSMEWLADLIFNGFSVDSHTNDVVMNLYIGAGKFDKARTNYPNLKSFSDSDLLDQQIKLFGYLNGASQPVPQPARQTTLSGNGGQQNQTETHGQATTQGQTGTYGQSGSYGQTQTQPPVKEPRRVFCNHCNGSGYICVVKTVPTYGTHTNVKTRCQHCSQLLEHGIVHVQRKCPHCQGKGYTLLY
jgi:TPR repeat protein